MKKIKSFWKKKSNILIWQKKPKTILKKFNNRNYWYNDGRLNIAQNCLINKNNKKQNKTAIIFVDKNKKIKKVSYSELTNKVEEFSIFIDELRLKNQSEIKNVLIHSSASYVSAVSMLTFAKKGIHFSVIFEDLPNPAISQRIVLIKPDLIITKDINKIKFFEETIKKNFLKKSKIICANINFNSKKTIYFNFSTFRNIKKKITYDNYNSNKKFFTLFTSGSTGEPKGIQHCYGGYMVYSKLSSSEKFGMNKDSVVLTASDAGWINGHTYALFSPLSFGATTILLEKPFTLIDYLFLGKILKKYKVTILYLPVTLLRLLKGIIPEKKKFLKHNLKALGAMGEPLAASIAKWYSSYFFKKPRPIVNTYFQTETGGILFAPKYNSNALKSYGTVGTPLNRFIKIENKNKKKFELEITQAWPGCMIDVINGKNFWNKYWKKNKFQLFDYGTKAGQNLIVHGRSDDVINIRGHRLGSGEVESKVLEQNDIVEVSAISTKHKIEGDSLILFVVKKNKVIQSKVKKNIQNNILESFGSYALPKEIYFVKELPKTKSGKILRRVLRTIVENKKSNLGDLSTILNNKSISKIKKII